MGAKLVHHGVTEAICVVIGALPFAFEPPPAFPHHFR